MTRIKIHFADGGSKDIDLHGQAPVELPPGVTGIEVIVGEKSAGTFTIPSGQSAVEAIGSIVSAPALAGLFETGILKVHGGPGMDIVSDILKPYVTDAETGGEFDYRASPPEQPPEDAPQESLQSNIPAICVPLEDKERFTKICKRYGAELVRIDCPAPMHFQLFITPGDPDQVLHIHEVMQQVRLLGVIIEIRAEGRV